MPASLATNLLLWLLNKLHHQMALSKIRQSQNLRNCPKCLSSKFHSILSIFRPKSPKETVFSWTPYIVVNQFSIFVVLRYARFAAKIILKVKKMPFWINSVQRDERNHINDGAMESLYLLDCCNLYCRT